MKTSKKILCICGIVMGLFFAASSAYRSGKWAYHKQMKEYYLVHSDEDSFNNEKEVTTKNFVISLVLESIAIPTAAVPIVTLIKERKNSVSSVIKDTLKDKE